MKPPYGKNKNFMCRACGEGYTSPLPLRASPGGLTPHLFQPLSSVVKDACTTLQVTTASYSMIMTYNPRIVESAICAVSTPFCFSSKADAPLFCRVSVYCQGDWLELTDIAPYDEWEHTIELDDMQYKVVYFTPDEVREACKDMATKDERLSFVDMQPVHLVFNQ